MDKSADAYRTISEVADELKLPQHVLRFWETRFPQIKPLKRGGNRRFYRPEDVELLRAIRTMLYGDGYTIKGVQRILKQQGPRAVAGLAPPRQTRASAEVEREAPPAPALTVVPQSSLPAPIRPAPRDIADAYPAEANPVADSPAPATPVPAGYSSFALAERLQAVLYDIAECERLLAAARA